jgi:hypothetical protein
MLANIKSQMTNEKFRNVVSLYFGSKVMVEWLDRVVRVVSAHEEPRPVGVPQILTPNKLAILTAEAHRSVDPLWHIDIVLPLREEVQVQLRTRGGHCKPAKQD